ncbi:hypothetical protein I4B36_004467 [Enterobacter hormaechei]|nr:hypothetical protein [Enterobacter hormaechei]
MQANWRGYRT